MSSALKHNQDYSQGLYEVSATALAPLGAVLDLGDGRSFRYGQVGAVALSAGHLCQAPATIVNHVTSRALDAPAAGSKVVTITVGATAVTENQYADGYLLCDATVANGGGATYKIQGHPAAAASAAVPITLYDPLWETVPAANTGGLIAHPCSGIVVHPGPPATALVGVTTRDMALGSFGWFQFRGICGVLTNGPVVVGNQVMASLGAVAGAVEAVTATYAVTFLAVGRVHYVAATTLFSAIDLSIT